MFKVYSSVKLENKINFISSISEAYIQHGFITGSYSDGKINLLDLVYIKNKENINSLVDAIISAKETILGEWVTYPENENLDYTGFQFHSDIRPVSKIPYIIISKRADQSIKYNIFENGEMKSIALH